MNNPAGSMFHNHQHVKNLKSRARYNAEVAGNDRAGDPVETWSLMERTLRCSGLFGPKQWPSGHKITYSAQSMRSTKRTSHDQANALDSAAAIPRLAPARGFPSDSRAERGIEPRITHQFPRQIVMPAMRQCSTAFRHEYPITFQALMVGLQERLQGAGAGLMRSDVEETDAVHWVLTPIIAFRCWDSSPELEPER